MEHSKGYEAEFVKNWTNDWFDKRTKEQFEADLNEAFNKINNV